MFQSPQTAEAKVKVRRAAMLAQGLKGTSFHNLLCTLLADIREHLGLRERLLDAIHTPSLAEFHILLQHEQMRMSSS
jgi:hypothetical protein